MDPLISSFPFSTSSSSIPCPLCHDDSRFSTVDQVYESLVRVTTSFVDCPVCGFKTLSLSELSAHILQHKQGGGGVKTERNEEQKNCIFSGENCNDQKACGVGVGGGTTTVKRKVVLLSVGSEDDFEDLLKDFTEIIDRDLNPRQENDGGKNNNFAPKIIENGGLKEEPVEEEEEEAAPHKSRHEEEAKITAADGFAIQIRAGQQQQNQATTTSSSNNRQQQAQCSLCGWNFDDENFLQLHKVLMHSNNNNTINIKSSSSSAGQRLRAVSVARATKYHCRQCKEVFRDLEVYSSHLLNVHGDPRHPCGFCGKLFKLRGSLLVHERVVHSSPAMTTASGTSNECTICNVKFSNKYRKNAHDRKHHHKPPSSTSTSSSSSGLVSKDPPHCCTVCPMIFESQAKLILHSVEHIKDQRLMSHPPPPPAVAITPPTFKDPINREGVEASSDEGRAPVAVVEPANSDVMSMAAAKGKPRFYCSNCNAQFDSESAFNQHHALAHGGGNVTGGNSSNIVDAGGGGGPQKQWECEVCHKSFTTKYFLKKHNRLHTGETPYKCCICGRAFSFQQSYHKHMLYHTDEKPYTCPTCGRSFKELSTLQNHERIHSGERPFECETCGKSFRQRVSYLVHRRIHTGVMPYSCTACGKSFRYKVTQRTHKCNQLQHQLSPDPGDIGNPTRLPSLPPQIQEDLRNFRTAKGRRQVIHDRLQDYLQKSQRQQSALMADPLAEMQQLKISELRTTTTQQQQLVQQQQPQPQLQPPNVMMP